MRLRQMRRVGGVVLATAAAVTMLAGCGGSSAKAPAAPAAAASPGGFGANGIQAYITCLNQHGVTIALPSRAPGQTRPSGAPRPSRSPGAGFGGGGFGGGGGGAFGGGIFNNASNPPTGVSQSAWTAALAACKSVQPSFSRTGGFGGGGNSAFTAYLNCLQQHGVTASRGPGGTGGFNSADPKLAAAEKACAPLRPTTRPTTSPTG